MKTKAKRKVGRKVVKTPAARAKARPKVTARPKAKVKGRATAKAPAKAKAVAKAKPARTSAPARSRWVGFVAKHGIVLASAKGPVPNVAEAVAGEPIVGSWWAHPKGKAIFAALCEIDDSPDVRCFKLLDGKVTFAHRKLWPALVRLAKDGIIAAEQLSAVQQEHMPSGEHRNIMTPFPDWVDATTAGAADKLSGEKARAQLAWIDAR